MLGSEIWSFRHFIERGADVDARHGDALRGAAENNHLDIVKYLIGQGANIHVINEYVLERAALNRDSKTAKYLSKLMELIKSPL